MNGVLTEKRYKSALTSLLLIVAFSGINLVLLMLNTNKYFLFSAYIPYLLGDYAMFYGGKYSAEYYKDFPDTEFFGEAYFALLTVIAAVVILFYLLCFFMAKKGKGVFLALALALFALDTVVMFFVVGLSVFQIIDIIFHIWAVASLALGVREYLKSKKSAADSSSAGTVSYDEKPASGTGEYSPVLRDEDKKSRVTVFCEADFRSHHIVYQRAKRANELIVDGRVYAEYEIFSEKEHTLEAIIDGFKIQAHYDGKMMTRILAEGKEIARKRRFI